MIQCILFFLGVTRQFSFQWCESTGEPFYIGRELDNMDERIANLKLQSGIGQALVSLRKRKLFKANQWRSLLLLSPILLKDILPANFYNHWMLLCHSIFMEQTGTTNIWNKQTNKQYSFRKECN